MAAEPQAHLDHIQSDQALGVITRCVLLGMVQWMLAFLIVAAVAVMIVPALQDLGGAGTAVFVAMFSGFGIIPGMIVGVGVGEARLERGE